MPTDARQYAPAAERNRGPILEVLQQVLEAETGTVLELGSGSGQHACHFARSLTQLSWQPSEIDPQSLRSIEAWRAHEQLANILPPLDLDVSWDSWPVQRVDAIFSANMIHIAPWEVCLGLLRGAGACLAPGGVLITYGPYRVDGAHTAPSNESFDRGLRARDQRWGVRELERVTAAAADQGLVLEQRVAMPANNFTLVFRFPVR
jgi:SAM-dependent methyltransferase